MAIGLAQQLDAGIEPAVVDDGILRIAGGVEDFQPRQDRLRAARQLAAADLAGDDHIGEEQIDDGAAMEQNQGPVAVFGGDGVIAELGHHLHHRVAHLLVILDDEDALAPAEDRMVVGKSAPVPRAGPRAADRP